MPLHGEQVLGATVQAELPQRLFRLLTEDGTIIIAGVSTEAKRLGLAICVGMHVQVKRASLDPGRGTILTTGAASGPNAPDRSRRSQS